MDKYAIPNYITAGDIKRVRKSLDLSQKEFANLIGCSKPTIERWESGKENVTGPIVLLLQMIDENSDYIDEIKIPEKKYPIRLFYMFKQRICTIIDVDEFNKDIKIKNYTKHLMFRAFGINEKPTFDDYNDFLKSRCFPETRDKLKLVLEDLNIPFYDPFLIIKKTEGRMAEDDFWIRIEE